MIPTPEDVEFHHVYDVRCEAQAKALVEKAWDAIERTYEANAVIDRKRRARAKRIDDSNLDHSLVSQILAQWISANNARSSLAGATGTAERAIRVRDEVAEISRQLASIAATLRFAPKIGEGDDIANYAEMGSAALQEALRPLAFANECALKLLEKLPRRAGKDGGLGAVIDGSPDRAVSARDWALTADLARYWTACGLSLRSGDAGDGLDRFLAAIIGENASRKALAAARKSMAI